MELYTVTTAPTISPVTLDNTKAFLRVTSTYEDDLITLMITRATTIIEAYTGRDIISRTYTGDFDSLMTSSYEKYPYIKIGKSPLLTLTSVTLLEDGEYVTVDSDNYQVKKTSGYPLILFREALDSFDDTPYPLRVNFDSGYGTAITDVPETLAGAIYSMIAFLYANRGDCISNIDDIPYSIKVQLTPFRIMDIFAI